jgi:hypothetical protein
LAICSSNGLGYLARKKSVLTAGRFSHKTARFIVQKNVGWVEA